MDEPEIILNLWYVFDDTGMVYSLRARAYVQGGTEEEKLAFLQRFAETDYLIAQPFPIPERFHTTFVESGVKKKMPVMPQQLLQTQGGPVSPGVLFDDAIKEIEKNLPAQTKLSIPETPLICLTPLFADEEGKIRPKIDGQVRIDRGSPGVRWMSAAPSRIKLVRGEWRVEIGPKMWAEILLFLGKRGWQPSVPAYYFLAPELDVAEEDAINLAVAGQTVLDEALRDPLAVLPVAFDMGKLAEIVCFCQEGAFRICR